MSEEAATEAVREEAKAALKEGAAEVVKEVAKDYITDKVNSRRKAEEEKELFSIELTIKDDEHRKKASPAIDGERLAEEITALKEFVASLFAEATASQIEDGRVIACGVVLVGGAMVLVLAAYLLHHHLCGRAAAETARRPPVYRGGVAESAALGLRVALQVQGRAPVHRFVTALATSTGIAAAPHPAAPSSLFADKHVHKNHLHSFAVRTYKKPPIYKVESESDGKSLQFKFRCTVEVGGRQFPSTGSFGRKKEAEQDAARVAYKILAAVGEDDIKDASGLIDQDVVFCKSILQEFAVKTKTTWPTYYVACLVKPLNLFGATVAFDGNRYTGESACTKKDAEQNAARAAIKSILATQKHNTCMVGIIRSKRQLITAVSGPGKPNHVADMLQNASYALVLQGPDEVPAVGTSASANPSSAIVGRSKSKKRKFRA